MNCTETTGPGRPESREECLIRIPFGLLGFERFKSYCLFTNPTEEPFLWLQVAGDPKLAFLVMSPFAVLPTYQPEIPDEDAEFLGLKSSQDALIFNVVTVRGPRQASINLKGPIVLNRHTLVAKQVIPRNATEFSVEHPLPIQDN
jgi:flagellar assembly factor FliW